MRGVVVCVGVYLGVECEDVCMGKGCVVVWWSFRVTRPEPVWPLHQRTLGSLSWIGQCIDSWSVGKKLQRRQGLAWFS